MDFMPPDVKESADKLASNWLKGVDFDGAGQTLQIVAPLEKVKSQYGAQATDYLVENNILEEGESFRYTFKDAEFLGVDTDNVELIREPYGEAFVDAIEEWVTGGSKPEKAHKNSLVILDSVGHLTTRAELEKNAEGVVIGGQAKLMASFVRRAKIWAALNNTAVVVLNHEYDPISFGGESTNSRFPNKQPSGGKKLEYAKDLSIILSRTYPKTDKGILRIRRANDTKGGRLH